MKELGLLFGNTAQAAHRFHDAKHSK
jgi:hypothetical protein